MSEQLESAQQCESNPEATWNNARLKLLELGISSDTNARAELVAQTTGEGLLQLTTAMHEAVAPGISHDISPDARHMKSMDGSLSKLMRPEDRLPLMNHAAELIRGLSMSRISEEDNKTFLNRSANIAGMAIVLTHHFVDGNGRTARTMGQAIRDGFDEQSDTEAYEDMRALSANRPAKGRRFMSYLPTGRGRELTPFELIEAAAGIGVPLNDESTYQQLKDSVISTPYGPE